MDALAEALTLGQPQGYVRVFADEGAPMGAAARPAGRGAAANTRARRAVPLGYLAGVGARSSRTRCRARARSRAAARRGGPGPGRAAERARAGGAAAGRGRQGEPEIAAELFVTLDTVKKHITHILGKLGAANRTEAVARARELGLVR